MLRIAVTVQTWFYALALRAAPVRAVRRPERGQSTAEYALVLLGAAAVALLLLAWAGKTDRITRLLNGVIDRVIGLGSP